MATKSFVFGRARKSSMLYFISDVGTSRIYLSLTLGTAKSKQLDKSCSFLDISYTFTELCTMNTNLNININCLFCFDIKFKNDKNQGINEI